MEASIRKHSSKELHYFPSPPMEERVRVRGK
jgi:hypothetical protein